MTKEQQELVNDLLNLEDGLSSWEIDFLDSLNTNFKNQELSDKQQQVLDRLSKRSVPRRIYGEPRCPGYTEEDVEL